MDKKTSEPASSVISLIHAIGPKMAVVDLRTGAQVQNQNISPNEWYLLQCTDSEVFIGAIKSRVSSGKQSLTQILIQDEAARRVIRDDPSFEKDYLELVAKVREMPPYV